MIKMNQITSEKLLRQIQKKIGSLKTDLPWKKGSRQGKVKRKHPEEDLQVGCVQLWRLKYPKFARLLYANLNQLAFVGDDSTVGRAIFFRKLARLKAMGLEKGIPDLMLAVSRGRYCGFYCELKVGVNDNKKEQNEMAELLRGQRYYVCTCWTIDEFWNEITGYMAIPTKFGGNL